MDKSLNMHATTATKDDIERIEKKLDALSERLPDSKKGDEKSNKATTKLATAGVIGGLGMKVGGVLGLKMGAITTFANVAWLNPRNYPVVKDVIHRIVGDKKIAASGTKVFGLEVTEELLIHTTFWSSVGSVVFGLPAAVLGYLRGDRLDKATDMVTKPIDAIHRLAISERQFAKEYPTHPRAIADKKSWGEAVEESREQTSSAQRG